jgi:hypothetical protein
LLLSSESPMTNDLFNLIFFFVINQLRGWLTVHCSICLCFVIWGQKVHMENMLNFPYLRKFDPIGNWGDLL